jgi:hypothetical protein
VTPQPPVLLDGNDDDAAEETELWEAELETELGSAPFGENLTVAGCLSRRR